MAERRPIVFVGDVLVELPAGDTVPGAGGAVVDFQDFTASGTWVHPNPGTLYQCYFEIYGGGGGGGGGAARVESVPAASSAGGGSGGSAGEVHRGFVVLSANAAVVVGAGGNGGNGASLNTISVTSQNGSNGTPGGRSSFAEFYAGGGTRGNAGTYTASPTVAQGTLPTLYRDGLTTVANVSYGAQGLNGATSAANSAGGRGYGGGGNSASIGATVNGTDGVIANNANAIATNASAPADQFGSGGAGGGGALVHSITVARIAAGGNGSAGAAGRVRVWAWPIGA